ncbi:MAG: TolC family protein, partial [Verrucomicrobiales bacterium]
RLRGEVASREADALNHAYRAKLLTVIQDITVAYYDYAYLREATRITDEIVDLLERLEEPVQEKVRGGGDQAPLLRLQVEIGKAQDELQTFQKLKPAQSAGLNGLLGRRGPGLLPFPPLDAPDAATPDRARMENELLADNPELKSLHSRIEKAAESIKLSRLSPIPDPTIGAGFFGTGEAVNPSTPGSGDNPWSVGVSFTIPLWFGKYKAENREAAQRYAEATKTLTDRENLLLADLEAVLQKLSEVDRRLDLYGNTLLPRARQAYEVTESSYQADRSSILDLIDSERSLLEIERTYWRAAAHHYQAIIRLKTLTGTRSQ